jgi:predicted RecB family nuclease
MPDRNSNYLIGIIIRTDNTEKEYSFWANSDEEENCIFIQLIELLKPLKSFAIYHYGSYEIQTLKNISKNLSVEYQDSLKVLIDNSFNLLNVFTHNIYPPTYSNSLKEIARFLKFEWSDKDASGLQSILWRYSWEGNQDEKLKNKLIRYNIEDCKALIRVVDWIMIIPKEENQNYTNVEKFKKKSMNKWGKVNFLVKELEQINNYAYFNYQREKVLIKTYPKIGL